MKKAMISIETIVEPTGVPAKIDRIIPIKAQNTDRIAEHITTEQKDLYILIAEIAGKITNAEINKEPTKFIANTIMTAIMIAINRLYNSTFVPVALAKLSSKVTAKILL